MATKRRRPGSRLLRKLKRRLCGEQGWRCCYCGLRLEMETATFEHVIPHRICRDYRWDNLVIACGPCNQKADQIGVNVIAIPQDGPMFLLERRPWR